MPSTRPEILAPAGDPLCLRAAIAAGADAVYLGMARFNARGRAERFRGVTLESCIRAAHDHGVKVYVTLNTLLHDDELRAAVDLALEALAAKADAAIVQDAGLASLLREHVPGLPLHGSTQMTLHQPEQAAEAVSRLGLRRVIAARECSAAEIARMVDALRPLGAGVETFVHGALCFAYSGQCLMSNFAGRRSANRGICAQNCRFDFTAGPRSAGDARGACTSGAPAFDRRSAGQLISLKDLAAFESVAALADAGVESFKIEGRLKGPEYVAEVTRLYRTALQAWAEGRAPGSEDAVRAARRVYSRGFTNGYLAGTREAAMRGDKRSLEGEPDATVLSANRSTGVLLLAPRPGHEVRAGQGYRYVHARYQGGFRVLSVKEAPRSEAGGRRSSGEVLVRVRFGSEARGRLHRRGATGRSRPPPPLPVGLAIHLNDDPELSKRVEGLVGAVRVPAGPSAVEVRISLRGRAGEPLAARAEASDGRSAEASSVELLVPAVSRGLAPDVLRAQLGRLGGTGYGLSELDRSALDPGLFVRVSVLNALRRDLVAALDAGKAPAAGRPDVPRPSWSPPAPEARRVRTALAACVGSADALRAAIGARADRVYLEGRGLDEVLSGGPGAPGGTDAWFRLPGIVHDGRLDRETVERIRAGRPGAGVLAGHLGQIRAAREAGLAVAADVHLNVTNHRTTAVLAGAGASRVAASLELEAREAVSLADACDRRVEVEVVVGGEVFSMLTRQDYGLAPGESFLATSEHGHAYRFAPARGGTTTLFEGRELVGVDALPILCGGVDAVRLDLAHHGPDAVAEIVAAYRAALDGLGRAEPRDGGSARPGAEVEEILRSARESHLRHAPRGAFAGHLVRGSRRLDAEGR